MILNVLAATAIACAFLLWNASSEAGDRSLGCDAVQSYADVVYPSEVIVARAHHRGKMTCTFYVSKPLTVAATNALDSAAGIWGQLLNAQQRGDDITKAVFELRFANVVVDALTGPLDRYKDSPEYPSLLDALSKAREPLGACAVDFFLGKNPSFEISPGVFCEGEGDVLTITANVGDLGVSVQFNASA